MVAYPRSRDKPQGTISQSSEKYKARLHYNKFFGSELICWDLLD